MFSVHPAPTEKIRDALKAHDDLIAGLLARRGIETAEAAEAFLSPNYDAHLHDPMLLTDMPKAAARLAQAIEGGEKIAVWSDYDCDGIPGAVVLHDFLKKVGANFTNYIPHRHLEGYGMNEGGLQRLSLEGVTLVITVDVGIVDVEPVAYARTLGMDVIVTDHHVPGDTLPDGYAVIDHKRADETYPFRELCGAATAWKLVCATLQHGFKGREDIPLGWEKWLLDMAGLSTIADMVPLVGENRVIATYGLLVMRKSPRIGLQKLLRATRVNQRFITEDDVGFSIAPRINAASRMGDPMSAFRLFTTEDENEADELVKVLEKANRGRRSAAGAITRQVHARLREREALPSVIAMGDPDWRPGLLGLVANSVADEYQRPVFLWGREATTLIKGSVRAGRPDVHVVKLMTHARDVFIEFGGHAQAGGFSVKEDQVFFLEEKLSDAHHALPREEGEQSAFVGDIALSPDDVSLDLLSKLSRLAPFGVGNPKPVVLLQDIDITEAIRFGKAEEHLKLRIKREFGEPLEAVAFYAKRDWEKKGRGSILGTLERDMFSKGQPVRLRLLDVI
jgi:single-stranded-DNA-specific exonuclease